MARELEAMSQKKLADEIHVTPAAISQYEKGWATPSADKLKALTKTLDVPETFFFVRDTGVDEPAFFRRLRSAPAIERKRARHYVQLVHKIAVEIEREARFPRYDVPEHPLTEQHPVEDAEEAASFLREKWGLPPGPIDDVVRTVERHGVIVATLAEVHDRIDAFSVRFPDRPVIMMSSAKGKRDRSRFDVAHELGHLVMHESGQQTTKHAEDQAHRFAAAFLMPEPDIKDELLPDRIVDWQRLAELKRKWHVSIGALLMRARALKRISPHQYQQAMKTMSMRGWRKNEPVDLGDPESPRLLQAGMEAAELSEAKLAERAGIPQLWLHEIIQATDTRPEVAI